MSTDDEDVLDLSPHNSHPAAARILTDEFYWDCTDENSPFGNDNGADTLEFFREWRAEHPESNPVQFLDQLLLNWGVSNESWDATDPAAVRLLLDEDELNLNTRDEVVIALAFAQLVLEGRVEPEIRRRALLALERQALPALLEEWGAHAGQRAQRIEKMGAALGRV